MKQKKLLILGGKPIGSCEIVEYAKSKGIYTIVTDYLPDDLSAAKKTANESWNFSTGDVEQLAEAVHEHHVDGIYTGVHEFNIRKMIELCTMTDKPCFCTLEQWDMLNNKRSFKKLCESHGVPVTREYNAGSIDDIHNAGINYPVIIKPVDGSGSRGFHICTCQEELVNAFPHAAENSQTGGVLIEQYMNYRNSSIINYTLADGEIYYCGMSDKHSEKVSDSGAPIMSVQFYPSEYERNYLENLDGKVKNMFIDAGLKNGVIWIEAFCNEGEFTFNEAGYRFGGSLTYLPVKYFYGLDQLALQVEYAMNGRYTEPVHYAKKDREKLYCILPVHVKPGKICRIHGFDLIEKRPELIKTVPVHFLGDVIQDWGSAQQVFAYIHFVCDTRERADDFARWIMHNAGIFGNNNEELMFNLYSAGKDMFI